MKEATNIFDDIINIQEVPERQRLLPELNKIKLTGITMNYHTWNEKNL